jgi:hypothetical protein
MNVLSYLAFLLLAAPGLSRHDEYKVLDGHKVRDNYHSPLPHTYIAEEDLPANFNWGNVDGRSYLTHSLNQHIPQCKSMEWELELLYYVCAQRSLLHSFLDARLNDAGCFHSFLG